MTVEQLIELACAHFKVSKVALLSESRKQELVSVRFYVFYIAKHCYGYNSRQIAFCFKKDGSTIRSSLKKTDCAIRLYPLIKNTVDQFRKYTESMNNTSSLPLKKEMPSSFKVQLKDNEVDQFIAMLHDCCFENAFPCTQLELLILNELLIAVRKKRASFQKKYTLTLSQSKTATVYTWLNKADFEHPLSNVLAIKIVADIHKQIN